MKDVFDQMAPSDRWRAYACLAVLAAVAFVFVLRPYQKSAYQWADQLTAFVDEYVPAPTENQATNDTISPGDEDDDGLSNLLEALLGSDPTVVDTDGDGFSDYDEFLNDFDPTVAGGVMTDEILLDRQVALAAQYDTTYQDPLVVYYETLLSVAESNDDTDRQFVVYQRMLDHLPPLRARDAQALSFAVSERRFDTAQAWVDRFLALYPDDWYGYFQQGYIGAETGDNAQAIKSYEQSLALGGDDVWLYNNYGAALDSMGRYDDAIINYQLAIEAAPNERLPYENMVNLLYYLRRYGQAKEYQVKLDQLPAE